MMTNLRRLAAVLLVLAGGLSGLMFSAARSDFVMRDCPGIPRAEWGATANCADGSFAQVLFGVTSALFIGLALVLWPRRRAA